MLIKNTWMLQEGLTVQLCQTATNKILIQDFDKKLKYAESLEDNTTK